MRIKNTDKKGFFNLFKKLAIWQRAVVVISTIVVAGGVSATVYGLATDSFIKQTVPAINSSDLSSQEPSSEIVSSNEPSSEVVSSKESSSEIVSSKETSSEVSSKESSKGSSKETTKTSSVAGVSLKAASSVATSSNLKGPEGYQERFLPYYEKNKDIAGWIKLAGTKLDYPVVQGKDNYYYLDKNVYKEQSGWGVPYMDYTVTSTKDYQSTNTIIYGHSDDKRGLQCSAIKGYRKIDFYKQHPTIEFDTVYADGTYKVVAFFITNQNASNWFPYHTFIDAKSDKEVTDYISNAKSRSYFNTNVDVVPTDKLLTIQTCEDTNSKNYNRLILVARKVRPDEDSSVDTSGATQNAAQVLPK